MSNATLHKLLGQRTQFLNFVRRRVQDSGLAEDILQAAYVRALEHGESLRQDESAVTWFYTVLRNAVIDHYRRTSTEDSAMTRWAHELTWSEGEPVATEPTRRFICGCIEHVLPSLRPAYAELLREVDLAEQPLTAYAKSHKLTAGNAAVRAHRARAALRKALAETCGACTIHACLDCVCKMPEAQLNAG